MSLCMHVADVPHLMGMLHLMLEGLCPALTVELHA